MFKTNCFDSCLPTHDITWYLRSVHLLELAQGRMKVCERVLLPVREVVQCTSATKHGGGISIRSVTHDTVGRDLQSRGVLR